MGNGDGTFRDETATRFPQTANALPTFIGSMQLLDVNGDGSSDIGAHFIGPDPRQGTFYLAQNGSLTEFANGGFSSWQAIDLTGTDRAISLLPTSVRQDSPSCIRSSTR